MTKSQNEKPWEKLPKKQIYITLKMNDCGQDLEKIAPFNASEAVQLLKTLSKNLAKVCHKAGFSWTSPINTYC